MQPGPKFSIPGLQWQMWNNLSLQPWKLLPKIRRNQRTPQSLQTFSEKTQTISWEKGYSKNGRKQDTLLGSDLKTGG